MRWLTLLLLIVLASPGISQTPSPEELAGNEKTLRELNLPTQGPELLKFFRDRTLSKEQIAQLSARVDLLSSPIYGERIKAAADLVKAGLLAKPFLVELTKNPKAELEAIRRAEQCLRQIAKGNEGTIAVASAHLVAKHKPAGAAEALLNYFPFATDPRTIEAVQGALNGLAMTDGKPEPVLVAALKDSLVAKRAAAGEALVRGGGLGQKPLVEPLLADPAPQVRLQVALALAHAKDKSAVPVLIAVIAHLQADQIFAAEDLLLRLAGDEGPGVLLAKTPPAKLSAAWQAWWEKNAAGVDLAELSQEPPLRGFTLITQMVPGAGLAGRVVELKPNKEVNFKIDNLRYPVDAQVVGSDRVLIAEYFNNRVTERDFKGNVVWEKSVAMPVGCQRLPGGQTFITSRRQLVMVDRAGKELFTYFAQNSNIAAAQRLRNGNTVVVSTVGQLKVLDPQGNEIRAFPVGQVYTMGGSIDAVPGGRFLLALYRENRVVEYEATGGRIVWQASVPYPTSAVRLPGGNTLVVSMTGNRVVELNPAGQEVWSYNPEGRPWRARRR